MTTNASWLWGIPRVGGPQVAGGEEIVVPVTTPDVAGNRTTTRLWRVETGTGEATPLTREGVDSTKPVVSADGRMVAFLRPVGEATQLHVMRLDGGEPEAVTDLPLGCLGARWMPDGGGLVLLASVLRDHPAVDETREELERRASDHVSAHVSEDAIYRYWDRWLTSGEVPHLFHLDLASRVVKDLIPRWRGWWTWPSTGDPVDEFDIAPDGSEVAFSADISSRPHRRLRFAVHTVDLESGDPVLITEDVEWHTRRPRYLQDGSGLIYGLQREPDFYADKVRLVRWDRTTGGHDVLTEEWDLSAAGWMVGDRIRFLAEERGRVPLWEVGLHGGTPTKVATAATLSRPAEAPDGTVYALSASLTSPPEVVAIRDGDVHTVTSFTTAALDGWSPPQVEEVEVPGHGGAPVQAFLVRPAGDHSRTLPLVHLIHGGPHGAFGDDWHWRWNAALFADPGYLVALVNFHGSTGFGQEFAASIHGRWGDQPTTDIEAVTDHLVETGRADPARLALAGGSYGGYLTAWITSQTDRYACAIAHAAVTNLPGMYSSDVTAGRERSYGAEVFEDLARVQRWSPAAHSAGYSTPTLVVHGDRDYRVPVTQGLELYGVLTAKGVDSRLVHYPDENHWILSPANSIHWYGEVLSWLARYLG